MLIFSWLEKAETRFTSRTVVALGIYPALYSDEIPAQFLNICGSSLPRKGWNGQAISGKCSCASTMQFVYIWQKKIQ